MEKLVSSKVKAQHLILQGKKVGNLDRQDRDEFIDCIINDDLYTDDKSIKDIWFEAMNDLLEPYLVEARIGFKKVMDDAKKRGEL
jgi:uncharacterized protein YjdB